MLGCGSRDENSQPVSALMETTLGPIFNLKSRYDHVILCSASQQALKLRAMSAVTRLVWNGLCEPLPFASPGKYQLQLDTGHPEDKGLSSRLPCNRAVPT